MDNTEFTAQLAQFSSLEQLTEINEQLEGLADVTEAVETNSVLSYLGKEVVFYGEDMPVADGYVGRVGFELESRAAAVAATIYDSDGSIVRTVDLGSMESGQQTFQWDGLDSDGNQVEDGIYTIKLTAYDSDGEVVAVNNQTASALVTGYEKDSETSAVYILMGDVALPVTDVLAVRAADYSQTSTDDSTSSEEYDALTEAINQLLESLS